MRRSPRSIPLGSEMYRTGSPQLRPCTRSGPRSRKPLPQALLPALGSTPPETRTMKPGRSLLSLPRPYVTHDPADGRPWLGEPVYNSSSAGAWLNCSVYIDLMNVRSSAIFDSSGSAADSQAPDLPCWANFCGVPSNFGTPEVKAKRLPFSSESGQFWPVRFTSSGL